MAFKLIILSRRGALSVLCSLLLICAGALKADTIDWNSEVTNGDYHTGSSWVGGEPPGSDDIARFDNAGTYGVIFEASGGFTNHRLYVNSGDVTFDLDGKTLNLTSAHGGGHDNPQPLTISGGSGTSLTVLNGTIDIDSYGTIGRVNESGSLTIGSGGSVVAGGDFLAGQRGEGVLMVNNGGYFSSSRFFVGHRNGGDGTATFTGATTTGSWSTVFSIGGDNASGELNVLDGAVLSGSSSTSSASAVNVATSSGSISGSILVSGAGSRLTHGRHMTIGNTTGVGTATVTVADGGRIEMGGVGINLNVDNLFTGDGSVRVTGASGVFTNAGILRPGLLDSEGAFTGGILNIERNYTQTADGILNINLGGTGEGDYGVVEFSDGVATLNGNLDVALVNGFEIDWDQFFHVLRLGEDGSMSGQFTGLDEAALVGTFGGINLYITYDPEAFGTSSGGVGLYTAIPEPHTFVLLFSALIGAAVLIRRRRS